MAEVTIAHPGTESTTEPVPEYVWRGRGLFETYREDLAYLGSGVWLIPSGSESGRDYEVRVGIRRPGRCECKGFASHKHCSHVVCAELAHKRSAICDSCGKRHYRDQLREVFEDDGLHSWYPGDRLCQRCIREGAWA